MLSLHTNAAALSAQNSISRTQSSLSTSQTRLSTGFRVNSAMDDAAGLQIATRLKYQTSGMTVAMRNTQNSISMMQTAEGALDETTNILVRMKDLATQAADGSSSGAAPNDRVTCSGGGDPYSVVRCRGTRPAARISFSIRSGGISCPHAAPADREIDSFISVPPRSFAPARSASATPAGPAFTHETCTFSTHG